LSPSSTLQTETGQQYAIRKALEAEQAKKAKKAAQNLRPPAVVTPGHEVDVESVITRTKKGAPSQQSHLGKLVALCEEHGWEVKAGASEYFTGDKMTEAGKFTEGRIERLCGCRALRGEGVHLHGGCLHVERSADPVQGTVYCDRQHGEGGSMTELPEQPKVFPYLTIVNERSYPKQKMHSHSRTREECVLSERERTASDGATLPVGGR
jgi:hypothetical protein